ncbi:MAG: amino acid racemase [Bacteroidetes bacterium]|nr:MAG: amino acid racemase [Bacteroidota bacterium]
MRTLGMIGGTSWHSTIEYYRLINQLVGEKKGTHLNPPLILYSLNIEVMRSGDKERINQTYLDVARKLRSAGAEALIICANTPHMAVPFVAPQIDIPFLHIADATGIAAQKAGLKTLGLLGNKPTMTGDFIPGRLKAKFGIETIIPDDEFLDQSHHFVSRELTQGRFTDEAKTFFLQQIERLRDKGADGIILGCTELPVLLKQSDIDFPLLPTTDLHAKMAADFITTPK